MVGVKPPLPGNAELELGVDTEELFAGLWMFVEAGLAKGGVTVLLAVGFGVVTLEEPLFSNAVDDEFDEDVLLSIGPWW